MAGPPAEAEGGARGGSTAPPPRIVVLVGPAGAGKTTVGTMLARALGCPLLEGDALHSRENVDRMRRGIPLTDVERGPWLARIRAHLVGACERGGDLVVACSALKGGYRRMLGEGLPILWVYLKGSPALLSSRLRERRGHFMGADMLESQLGDLEEPSEALVLDAAEPPARIVARILAELRGASGVPRPIPAASVRVFPTLDELSLHAAEAVVGTLHDAVRARGRCSLVLSGGGTPRPMYSLLAANFRDRIPWRDVHVFWADERYVPAADRRSNYRMAREALLDHVPCPDENVHPMPTHFASPDAAARAYRAMLEAHFDAAWPSFDLVCLGMGEDGHTASLFPGSPAVAEPEGSVMAVRAHADPPLRLTLTLPALTPARHIHVLVAGSEKSRALRRVLGRDPDPGRWPAAGIRATEGALTWWLDRAAAAGWVGASG